MKFLVIGDPHFKTTNVFETDQMDKEVTKLVKQNKYDAVVLMGDILHNFEKIHMQPLNRVSKFVKKLSKYCIVYILVGNHDRPNNKVFLGNDHSLYCLKKFKNVIVVDNVFELELDEDSSQRNLKTDKSSNLENENENIILFVPYVENGRFREAIDLYDSSLMVEDKNRIKLIFCHQEFKNCVLQNNIISENGDEWGSDDPLIMSGHIHHFHIPKPNILYVGTPFAHSFNENNEHYIFEIDTEKIDGTRWSNVEYAKLQLSIKNKRSVVVDVKDCVDIDLSEYEKYDVRFVVVGERDEIKEIFKISEVKRKFEGAKYTFRSPKKEKNMKMIEKEKENVETFESMLNRKIGELGDECKKEFDSLFE